MLWNANIQNIINEIVYILCIRSYPLPSDKAKDQHICYLLFFCVTISVDIIGLSINISMSISISWRSSLLLLCSLSLSCMSIHHWCAVGHLGSGRQSPAFRSHAPIDFCLRVILWLKQTLQVADAAETISEAAHGPTATQVGRGVRKRPFSVTSFLWQRLRLALILWSYLSRSCCFWWFCCFCLTNQRETNQLGLPCQSFDWKEKSLGVLHANGLKVKSICTEKLPLGGLALVWFGDYALEWLQWLHWPQLGSGTCQIYGQHKSTIKTSLLETQTKWINLNKVGRANIADCSFKVNGNDKIDQSIDKVFQCKMHLKQHST